LNNLREAVTQQDILAGPQTGVFFIPAKFKANKDDQLKVA